MSNFMDNLNTFEELNPTPEQLQDLNDRILKTYWFNDDTGCIEKRVNIGNNRPRVALKGKLFYTARAIWCLYRGPVAKDMRVCHKCDNEKCINLHHLFLGTHSDNMQDMNAKGRNNKHKIAGQNNIRAALNTYDINRILNGFYIHGVALRELSRQFCVDRVTITKLVKNISYKTDGLEWSERVALVDLCEKNIEWFAKYY